MSTLTDAVAIVDDTTDSADLLGMALLRADGRWGLAVHVDAGHLVAEVVDGQPDPIAVGMGGSLDVALEAVRRSLGARVREAVGTP